MKRLSIQSLVKYELTSEEKSKVFAGDPIELPSDFSSNGYGDPDTDGEEECFKLPPGGTRDECYEKNNKKSLGL
ncbi:hypothetical protein P8625_05870 [Tenacibaculum tangerinum]|uniref:Uncharacterized protein n=1 Tax=Tenacibaculum tangerinum TaxID=3038772 RepID=A0ABY8L5X1_9FLAO|nr:hypothetical protein [Tenacibaculum tangerinum]WGH76684.1 hypothetical protein P8625_05870 [Tenacibaculum tangerinum]